MEDWEWQAWAEAEGIEDFTTCAVCKEPLDDLPHFICDDCNSFWSKEW